VNLTARRFWKDEDGAELVEWAVLTIILLVATVPALLALTDELLEMFKNVFDTIEKPPPDTY
jgi:Flp pilus assembly pilin Flp